MRRPRMLTTRESLAHVQGLLTDVRFFLALARAAGRSADSVRADVEGMLRDAPLGGVDWRIQKAYRANVRRELDSYTGGK